jgi:hypothetical protein
MTNSGVTVEEGVLVNVGDEVGEEVNVSVGIKVEVGVTVSLGEGSGLRVHVGSMVGVGAGCVINPTPPHPTISSVIARRVEARPAPKSRRGNLIVDRGDCFALSGSHDGFYRG